MKYFLLISLLVATHAGADELDPTLSPFMGQYRLKAQDQLQPCNMMTDDLVEKYGVRLSQRLETPGEGFVRESTGDLNVFLETYYDNIGKWHGVFDRAPFTSVNEGTSNSFIPIMRLRISHKTTWNPEKLLLVHDAKMTEYPFQGAGSGIQAIKFNKNRKEFVYSYYLREYNGLGVTVSTELAGRCSFERTLSRRNQ